MTKQQLANQLYVNFNGDRSHILNTLMQQGVGKAYANTLYYNAKKANAKPLPSGERFDPKRFDWDGMYLMYQTIPGDRSSKSMKFVARFKHSVRDKNGFQKFLIENFTTDEYFARLDSDEAPAETLRSKGYVSTTVKRILKQEGYPQTADGYEAYLNKQVEIARQQAQNLTSFDLI